MTRQGVVLALGRGRVLVQAHDKLLEALGPDLNPIHVSARQRAVRQYGLGGPAAVTPFQRQEAHGVRLVRL